MIVVRNSFIAKPGQAGKLAATMKEMGAMVGSNYRVMTDMTGEFNHVIFEFEVESLAAFEDRFQQYSTDPKVKEKMAGYTELWVTGRREVYRVM